MGSYVRGIAAAGFAILVLAGCVIFPTPTTPILDIPESERTALKPGQRTRAEILMRFGEPDLRLDGDHVLVYRWERVRATLVLIGGGLALIPITDAEAIFLAFDDAGRLARVGAATAWKKSTIAEQAAAWAKGDGAEPAPAPKPP
jgi:hypothetical protein